MPDSVIKMVHLRADKEKQPKTLEFANRHLEQIDETTIFDDVAPLIDVNVAGVNDNLNNDTILNDLFADNHSIANDEAQNEIEREHRTAEGHMGELTGVEPEEPIGIESDEPTGVESDEPTGVNAIDIIAPRGQENSEANANSNEETHEAPIKENDTLEHESKTESKDVPETVDEDPEDNETNETNTNINEDEDPNTDDDESVISEIDEEENEIVDDGAI